MYIYIIYITLILLGRVLSGIACNRALRRPRPRLWLSAKTNTNTCLQLTFFVGLASQSMEMPRRWLSAKTNTNTSTRLPVSYLRHIALFTRLEACSYYAFLCQTSPPPELRLRVNPLLLPPLPKSHFPPTYLC